MNCFLNVNLLSYVVNPESFPTIIVNSNPKTSMTVYMPKVLLSFLRENVFTITIQKARNIHISIGLATLLVQSQ